MDYMNGQELLTGTDWAHLQNLPEQHRARRMAQLITRREHQAYLQRVAGK